MEQARLPLDEGGLFQGNAGYMDPLGPKCLGIGRGMEDGGMVITGS